MDKIEFESVIREKINRRFKIIGDDVRYSTLDYWGSSSFRYMSLVDFIVSHQSILNDIGINDDELFCLIFSDI